MFNEASTATQTATNVTKPMVTVLMAAPIVVAAFAEDCKVNGRKSPPFALMSASTVVNIEIVEMKIKSHIHIEPKLEQL